MKTATRKPNADSALAFKPLTKLCRSCAIVGLIAAAGQFQASAVSVRFEAGALGNIGPGNTNTTVNDGGNLDTPIANKLTLGAVGSGVGSTLFVQTDGTAGPGSLANPLFVTVTARSHLDNTVSFGDYQAGAIYITAGTGGLTSPKDKGLGVRAFTVNETTGLREAGLTPSIEGSKEVSGGTDSTPTTMNNGAPHVDEDVTFDFAQGVLGSSINVVLTKFDDTGTNGGLNGSEDVFDLLIKRTVGPDIVINAVRKGTPPGAAMITEIGAASDQVVNVNFGALVGLGLLGAADVVTSFSIRANDDNPSSPAGTAEHFLINGLTVGAPPPPSVPDGGSTIALLGLALMLLPVAKAFHKQSARG